MRGGGGSGRRRVPEAVAAFALAAACLVGMAALYQSGAAYRHADTWPDATVDAEVSDRGADEHQDVIADTALRDWSEEEAPDYALDVGGARFEGSGPPAGSVRYSGLDSLGRTGRAEATITCAMVGRARGRRLPFSDDSDPSGWPDHNFRARISFADGSTYNGYFWNRSHLIANSLGGDAERHNLITGTRAQNVGANDGGGGMAHCEKAVRDWFYGIIDGKTDLEASTATVRYSATPVYSGDELVPRWVIVDMRSSDGSIDTETIVYNAAAGYEIDYSTGAVRAVSSADAEIG